MILVTGATGFIGRALCASLLKHYPVRIAVRDATVEGLPTGADVAQKVLSIEENWANALIDVDTIVQSDISELWNTDIGDYIMAAAQDPGKNVACEWGGIPNYKELGLSADTMYFNSGVLIIKPKEWREQKIAAQVMEALVKYKEHVRLADQYGLNVIMANKWKQLDPKWNWFAFQEDVKPYLIHFLDIKPIFTSYNSQPVYKDEFFRYLKMTPWKNFKPQSGHRRTLRKIFNKIKNGLKVLFFKKD